MSASPRAVAPPPSRAEDRSAEAALRAPARRVAVFGLDNFSRKNRAQLSVQNARGYAFDVFTSDTLHDSAANLPPGNTITLLAPDLVRRTAQIVRYLRAHAAVLNHVEVYPGGRFAAVYVALARAFGVPTMVVERGDLLYEDRYGAVTRASMRAAYRLADLVWYRELYQERRLRELGARALLFLSNAVGVPGVRIPPAARTTDFAWVNRLITERRADWLVEVLAEPDLAGARVEMLGFLEGRAADAGMRERQAYVLARRPANLTTGAFGDPSALYRRARFFVLPSEIVFANNALLEAMAHGVVPLVSDVEGARRIVEDGVDGFVFQHSRDGLRDAMRRARALDPASYEAMSAAAIAKVRARFSVEEWGDRLAATYAELARGRR